MDSVGLNVIKTAALGRSFELGMLYDCRKDALIPGIRLWNKEEIKQNTCSRIQINTDFKVTASDSIQDKFELLNIDGGLSLSVLCGLVNVSGAGKYLKDTKTSSKQQRLTLHYNSTSRFEELIINHLPSENILIKYDDDDDDIATHVVTGVLFGADACFVFDREVSSNEDTSTKELKVKVALEKLYGSVSVNANASLRANENQKSEFENFTCTFHGDFKLASNPTSFEDAVKVFADLPNLLGENQELAVPLRVWLYPLDKLHSKVSKLHKDISMDLIVEIESLVESLNIAEMKCSDLLKNSPAQTFVAFKKKILQMKKNCNMYKLRFRKKLCSLLPNIRGDMMKETVLHELLQENDESPFRRCDLEEWLEERERESEIIESVLTQLKDCGAQIEDNIDAILMDLEVGNLVSYTFTSLNFSDVLLLQQTSYLSPSVEGETNEKIPDSQQKSWLTAEIKKGMRKNLKMFKNLIDSKDCKPARFIFSSVEMEDNPGSCILLHESECDEAVCFTPPSKPACPITEEVEDQNVVLKVPSSCPATVELRLLYKMKKDTVWTIEPVLKDQDTVTLTDLREDTEYEIKYTAVGKLNYTVDSDVISGTTEGSATLDLEIHCPAEFSSNPNQTHLNKLIKFFRITTLQQSTWSRAVKGNVHLTGKQKLNLVLYGSDETLKNSVSKLIRGEAMNPSHQRVIREECVRRDVDLYGRLISLVELPAFSRLSEEEVRHQTLRCVSLCDPGIHVFLLIIPDTPLTDEDTAEIEKIQKIFDSSEHFILLFTTEDTVEGFVNDFVESSPECQGLISLCGDQYRVMRLNEPENSSQIPDLLDYIENMKTEPYSLQMFVDAQEKNGMNVAEEFFKDGLSQLQKKIDKLQHKLYCVKGESDDQDSVSEDGSDQDRKRNRKHYSGKKRVRESCHHTFSDDTLSEGSS